jgi:hypothetical protein
MTAYARFLSLAVAGVITGLWLVWDLGRVGVESAATGGAARLIANPMLMHKVGELMILAPLVLIGVWGERWEAPRRARFVKIASWVMGAGALLNLLAWAGASNASLNGELFRGWCLILVAVGATGAPVLKGLGRMARLRLA